MTPGTVILVLSRVMLTALRPQSGRCRMTEQVLDSDLYLNSSDYVPGQAGVQTPHGWQAGELIVDIDLRCLYQAGDRVTLQEMPLRLLCLLLERGGRPLSRRELHERLWPRYGWDSFERNLNTAVRKLRRAIGDDAREPRLIETLRASGYRWIGATPSPLLVLPADSAVSTPAGAALPAPAALPPAKPASYAKRRQQAFVAAGMLLLLVAAAVVLPSTRPVPQPWVNVSAGAIGPGDREDALHALRQSIAGIFSEERVTDSGGSMQVDVTLHASEPVGADVRGRGPPAHVALAPASFGRERLLVELASRAPPTAVKAATPALPAPAEREFADASTLLIGATDMQPVDRAIKLLEGVLAVAPDHVGALRIYARAQRTRAVLGRDPALAAEHRALARSALRRAVLADPRSAALAADVGAHLFWADHDIAQAADWYAVARRAAPQDADILHAQAWFLLARNRIDEAMTALNAALSIAPLSVALHADLGWFYLRTGRTEDALRQCRVALEMSAADSSAQICEERALADLGRPQQAWDAVRRHAPGWLDPDSTRQLAALPAAEAYRAAMHIAARKTRERIGAGFDSACLEAVAGERDAAVADLAAAESVGDPGLLLAGVSPELVRLLGLSEARRLANSEAWRPPSSESG